MSQLSSLVSSIKVHGHRFNIDKQGQADLLEDILTDLEWDIVEDWPLDPETGEVDWELLKEENFRLCLELVQ